jgi:hypothetical protein
MSPLKLDKPQIVARDPEGITVARHFEDGSRRTTIYRPDGTARIITDRTNPSTGATEHHVQEPDGSTRLTIETPGGDQVIVSTAPDGSIERTEISTSDDGNLNRTTTFPDGTTESEVQFTQIDGSRQTNLTGRDGSLQVTNLHTGTTAQGETFFTEVTLAADGSLVRRTETLVHPDGSSTETIRDGAGASHVVQTTTKTVLPDGAVRQHVERDDGTDETTLFRTYTQADGTRVEEVHSDDRVQIVETRADSISDVTRFEDGTQMQKNVLTMPDGAITIQRIDRDKSFEETEQLPGDPVRTVTRRSDFSRMEQAFDGERMITTLTHPDGTRSVTRLDPDGFGSTADFDKDGNLTLTTIHNGEPLEPRGGLPTDETFPEDFIGGSSPNDDAPSDDAPDDAVLATPVDVSQAEPTETRSVDDSVQPDSSIVEPSTDSVLTTSGEPDENAPVIEIDDDGNIEVHDFAETVNVAYTVTETPGGDIGPDPDAPLETPMDNPLEQWDPDDVIEVDDYAETVNVAYTVTETPGGDIGPDPDAPLETPMDNPLEQWDPDDAIEIDDYAETVNYAYTVTETPGGDIGPDPDAPTETSPETEVEPEAW